MHLRPISPFFLLVALAAPAYADDIVYAGSLNASSGASTNNNAAACTTAAGATAAIGSLGGTAQKPIKLYVQCTVDVRLRTGSANTVAAANSGANLGLLISADQAFPLSLKTGYLAIIPASGSGSARCDLFRRY